jgi:hypothetical protein
MIDINEIEQFNIIYKVVTVMKEIERLISFMIISNDLTSSQRTFNDLYFNKFIKTNFELANWSYHTLPYCTVPFFDIERQSNSCSMPDLNSKKKKIIKKSFF